MKTLLLAMLKSVWFGILLPLIITFCYCLYKKITVGTYNFDLEAIKALGAAFATYVFYKELEK